MHSLKPLLIMKTGQTLDVLRRSGEDFEDWIVSALGVSPTRVSTIAVYEGAALPEPDGICGVIITGSPAMVTDGALWNERTAEYLREVMALQLPVLGICYGHQLLAYACGGQIHYHPLGTEIGTVPVHLRHGAGADLLLRGLPDKFIAHTSHSQSVLSLPAEAVLLASSEHDSHHCFRMGERAWGVQFHPEFNARVMRTYVLERQSQLIGEGLDITALLDGIEETPAASQVLRNFAALLD